ncbi:unnamed protein product [Durusdinium trenchii]|uniref:Uncharacterized protein n=2 Tax=Durusdinium trenchii TaxID=1381693 RepID=A0ABP0LVZ3_9DINO
MMVVAGLALETLWDLDKRVVIPTLDVSKYHFVDQAVPRHILGAGISSIELSCGVAREKPMNSAASSAAIASSPSVVQPQQPAIASAPASSTVPEVGCRGASSIYKQFFCLLFKGRSAQKKSLSR